MDKTKQLNDNINENRNENKKDLTEPTSTKTVCETFEYVFCTQTPRSSTQELKKKTKK